MTGADPNQTVIIFPDQEIVFPYIYLNKDMGNNEYASLSRRTNLVDHACTLVPRREVYIDAPLTKAAAQALR